MKNIVIFDIDGTITDPSERVHFLEKKDWKSFYEACDQDTAHQDILRLLIMFQNMSYEIVFCTGRVESVREKTEKWLSTNCYLHGGVYKLLMRKDGDNRLDSIVKPELIQEEGIKLENVFMVFEDRDSMVKQWRSMGLRCLQVQEGDF